MSWHFPPEAFPAMRTRVQQWLTDEQLRRLKTLACDCYPVQSVLVALDHADTDRQAHDTLVEAVVLLAQSLRETQKLAFDALNRAPNPRMILP